MKKRVNWDELNALTESQKNTLRQMWQPEKYELIAVPMCQDLENEAYDYDIYVIQALQVNSINEDKRYGASRFPVKDYEYHEVIFEAIPLQQSSWEDAVVDDADADAEAETAFEAEEDLEPATGEKGYLINKECCLPALDIAQMLEMLERKKDAISFSLEITPEFKVCRVNEFEFEGDCLCDLLWQALQKIL